MYKRILQKSIKENLLDINSSVLIVGAGPNDLIQIQNLGLKNVLFSNLDYHGGHKDFKPYKWLKSDINKLDFEDNTFDVTITSATLHHLFSPHRGLCEMLRVSRRGIVVIESSDNLLTRVSKKLKVLPEYEIDAILKDGKGGVENTHIPNHIYRWTKEEVKKTVKSFLPHTKNRFYFLHGYTFPHHRLKRQNSLKLKIFLLILYSGYLFMKTLFPRQGNEFGFIVRKGDSLHPWLEGELCNSSLNKDFLRKNYKTTL